MPDPSDRDHSGKCDLRCSLSAQELEAQRSQLIPGLFEKSDRVESIRNGFRFQFTKKRGVVNELAELIEKESACCSFLCFSLLVSNDEGPVTLEVTGPPGTVELLESL